MCGWLKDRFGLSWQIIPEALPGCWAIRTRPRRAGDGRDAEDAQLDVAAMQAAADG